MVPLQADHRAVRPPGFLESFRKWLWGKMRAGRFCGSQGLEVSGWRGPARVRCPSRLLARFPVRAGPPPALGQRAELSVSALGRAGARGPRSAERGERVGRGPAPAKQADTRPQLPAGSRFPSPAALWYFAVAFTWKDGSCVSCFYSAIMPFGLKKKFLSYFFLFKPLLHMETFGLFLFYFCCCYSFFRSENG